MTITVISPRGIAKELSLEEFIGIPGIKERMRPGNTISDLGIHDAFPPGTLDEPTEADEDFAFRQFFEDTELAPTEQDGLFNFFGQMLPMRPPIDRLNIAAKPPRRPGDIRGGQRRFLEGPGGGGAGPGSNVPKVGKRRVLDVPKLGVKETTEVIVNPSIRDLKQLKALAKSSTVRGETGSPIRYSIHPDTREVHVWSAFDATHADMADQVPGLPTLGRDAGLIEEVEGQFITATGFDDAPDISEIVGRTIGETFGEKPVSRRDFLKKAGKAAAAVSQANPAFQALSKLVPEDPSNVQKVLDMVQVIDVEMLKTPETLFNVLKKPGVIKTGKDELAFIFKVQGPDPVPVLEVTNDKFEPIMQLELRDREDLISPQEHKDIPMPEGESFKFIELVDSVSKDRDTISQIVDARHLPELIQYYEDQANQDARGSFIPKEETIGSTFDFPAAEQEPPSIAEAFGDLGPIRTIDNNLTAGPVKVRDVGDIKDIDVGFAPLISELAREGFKTVFSHSALRADHPGEIKRDISSTPHIAFAPDNLTDTQWKKIHDVAKKHGLQVELKEQTVPPGLFVRGDHLISGKVPDGQILDTFEAFVFDLTKKE